ncbi:MAG TPA: imidazolonepropionase [Candidatus Syntrophosphaera thermopropionivorans]|nr:imidazolonepropionase [Candidatus Syntrophosphaera thermopropionivorans]
MRVDTIVRNCRQLITCKGKDGPLKGKEMSDIVIFEDGALAIKDGYIVDIGSDAEIAEKYTADEIISAKNYLVLPGFVDCHTHPVFVHTREDEFALRLQGYSYMQIAKAGGGILNTIKTTRNASEELLFDLAKKRIEKMMELGTTTLEAKSGYGLDTESELKMLRVIDRLAKELPVTIVPTFLGAHEYPEEYKNNHEGYLDLLCNEMIPAVAKQGIARFCDIFTEADVFSIEESRKVLNCAKQYGFQLKMHADEIEPLGGAELAAELGCISADHLGSTSDAGIKALKDKGVIPVLLPATLFSLGSKTYARGREMIDMGLPVALATDYNPGSCNCDSIPLTMSIACIQMKLIPVEAFCATTINAAYALGLGDKVGSLEIGKQADFTIWDIPSLNFIPYHLGSSYIVSVYAKGKCIYKV